MRRNPHELDLLKEQFLLGDTSVADSLWQMLEALGKLPPIYATLMSLFGENSQGFNDLSGWVNFINSRMSFQSSSHQDVRIFRNYCLFITYASAMAAATYYSQDIELAESFPLPSNSWQPGDDIRWREILKIANEHIYSKLRVKDYNLLDTHLIRSQLNNCLSSRSYLVEVYREGTPQYRNLTFNETGRSYVARIYPTIKIDSPANVLTERQKITLRNSAKAVCASAYKLAESLMNEPYIVEPDEMGVSPLSSIFIDIGRQRLQDIDELTYSRQFVIPCHLDYAYDSYISAVQAFTTDVLSVEEQAYFDQIWRRYLKELMLLFWFSTQS